MRNGFIGLAILGTIAIPGAALAQSCPPGQILQAGVCRIATAPAPSAAVPAAPTTTTTTAVAPTATAPAAPRSTVTTTTTAAPAAVSGSSAAPVVSPTAGASQEKVETCPTGFSLYNHGCYPAHDAANAMMR
jgi:hypothetical protein